jgi:hypothetical protein
VTVRREVGDEVDRGGRRGTDELADEIGEVTEDPHFDSSSRDEISEWRSILFRGLGGVNHFDLDVGFPRGVGYLVDRGRGVLADWTLLGRRQVVEEQ